MKMQNLPAPPTPTRKRRHWFLWIVLILVGLMWLASRQTQPPDVSDLHRVAYQVDGPAGGSMTFENANGDTSQNSAKLPWSYSFQAPSGAFLYVSAQNNADHGDIICTIEIDGNVAETNTSSGPYAICSASGTL